MVLIGGAADMAHLPGSVDVRSRKAIVAEAHCVACVPEICSQDFC
jgi:hypothetical protein